MNLPTVFADECCSAHLVRELRAVGFNVFYVIENEISLDDPEQALRAFQMRRVLISADYDFGELAVRHGQQFVGLLLLAPSLELENASVAPEIAARILAIAHTLTDNLTNLSAETVRQRPL